MTNKTTKTNETKVYLLTEVFNRDDACEVIADERCYARANLGVYATKDLAEAAAKEAKKKFFDGFEYQYEDEEDEDTVREQVNDDECLDIYAEDYPFHGEWGDFIVRWDITEFVLNDK